LSVIGNVNASSYTGSLQYFEFDQGTNTTYGIGIGEGAIDNYSYGIGIGFNASINYNGGIGIGSNQGVNYDQGIGIGDSSNTNYESGIGIGYGAYNNYTEGIGIGASASENNGGGIGIGSNAITNGLGYGTVAIGYLTNAERQNEFVTSAGSATITNKAQSIIQKFKQISLASSGGIWQEIFTDASSARLTILASSIYHYRIQINAIGAIGFLCKTWEITGAVKRDASNNTIMVGGLTATPTYSITAEDSGTNNWDVEVSADDTNEALKIEVKHDYGNNVTFSATVWATETRL
jgi:hypothetical protein